MINKIRKKRIDSMAIVVINDKIYNRNNVSDAEWIKMLELCEEVEQSKDYLEKIDFTDELLDLLIPARVKQREEEVEAKEQALKDSQLELDFDKRMKKAKRIADISGLFEYDDEGITYLKGFKHPMPKILVEALLDAHYNPNSKYTVNSLVNFWKYLLLNPDKHVRKGLFQWIDTGKFALTEDGNIISYRNVDVKKQATNKKLQDFISESWSKVKRWKKSPKNYTVWTEDDSTLKLSTSNKADGINKIEGNLAELYADLDTQEDITIYTDNYSRTMEIKLGEVVSMDRSSCDNSPTASCSRGLHQKTASHGWNFGSNALVCLTNPYHVVAIPEYDHSKFRCCQYFPVSKAEVENYSIVEFDPGTYDIPYNGLETLSKLLETKSLSELQESGEISSELEAEDFDFVMTKAREVISKRVIELD